MTTTTHDEHLRDRVAMAAVRALLKLQPPLGFGPESRPGYDALLGKTPPADGVTYEAGQVGGLPGWWCRPAGAAPTPAILYLHGGAYVLGSAMAYRHFVGQIAARARTAAFIPDYGLAPERPFPAAVDDARAAWRGLVAAGHAVALAGDSGGGGLALALLLLATAEARRGASVAPVAAATLSPWTDLALTGASVDLRAGSDPLLTRTILDGAAAAYLGRHDRRDPRASPLYGDFAGCPPVMLHVGEDEILLDDTRRVAAAIRAAGGVADAHVWRGMTHVFPSNVATLRAAREALDLVGDFLRQRFAGAA